MYVSLNGKIIQDYEAQPILLSEGFLYGYGLFETIKVYNGKMYFFYEHLERMRKGCIRLNINLIFDEEAIQKYCNDLILQNQLLNGSIRITYTKNKNDYILIINTKENSYTEENYIKGFKLCFADIRRNPYSPLVYIKSNNYLENILARQEAKEKGFDEAIFLNINGRICEGTISNIFFVKNKIVYTPNIECGILNGILRDKVIEAINKLDFEIRIGEYEKEQLLTADEIFITNSLMDIMPVSVLEYRKLDIDSNNITRALMKEIKKLYR